MVRDERVKILRAVRPLAPEDVLRETVRGQYDAGVVEGPKQVPGYRGEKGVSPTSSTSKLRRAQAVRRQLALGGRALLPAHRQAAAAAGHRGGDQFKRAPFILFRETPVEQLGRTCWCTSSPTRISLSFEERVPGPVMRLSQALGLLRHARDRLRDALLYDLRRHCSEAHCGRPAGTLNQPTYTDDNTHVVTVIVKGQPQTLAVGDTINEYNSPAGAARGSAINTWTGVSVEVVDKFGNQVVSGVTGTVTMTSSGQFRNIQTDPFYQSTTSVAIDLNTAVATFSNLQMDPSANPAGSYTITATASGVTLAKPSVTSNPFYFDPGAANERAKLAFLTPNFANMTFNNRTAIPSFEVAVENAAGATLTNDNSTQLTISTGNIYGTLTRTVVNGVATFNDLDIQGLGGIPTGVRVT